VSALARINSLDVELGLDRGRLRIGLPKGLRHEARRERHGASNEHRCDLHRWHGSTGRALAR
jgi:hypothetical protein